MASIDSRALNCNKKININFEGGDLSSDAGLLLIKEFAEKIGLVSQIRKCFKTTDEAVRYHTDDENLMQVIYQILAAYFEDDCADELKPDPVFRAILDKDTLASQPTLSRFFNRMDENTLAQFDAITKMMRKVVYSIQKPEQLLLDLDSTLLPTYGAQEGEGFNYHYRAHGYHPLLCYDGLTAYCQVLRPLGPLFPARPGQVFRPEYDNFINQLVGAEPLSSKPWNTADSSAGKDMPRNVT